MSIRINVDPANPGQFFACCGLLELADRLWDGAEGWFAECRFNLHVRCTFSEERRSLTELTSASARALLHQTDVTDDFSSSIQLGAPFNLRLDWWHDNESGGNRLKPWAGSMRCVRIARSMQAALQRPDCQTDELLDRRMIVYDPIEPDKKVEPFYFDARRGANAQALDIGFSPDSLQMTTIAYPTVEFLCLVGLQRFRPKAENTPRIFEYSTWEVPLPANIASLAACGALHDLNARHFRFENAFRTEQRKHKAFTPATEFYKEPQ